MFLLYGNIFSCIIAECISVRLLIQGPFKQCMYICVHSCLEMWGDITLECRGFDVTLCAGLRIHSLSERHQLYSTQNLVVDLKVGGVLVMEVEESQSEQRRRLATERENKRDTCTTEESELNKLQRKNQLKYMDTGHGQCRRQDLSLTLALALAIALAIP